MRTDHRPSRARSSMTVDEAEAIVRQAEEGRLAVDDPDVRRVVGQANRVLVRAGTWGADRSPRSRRTRRFVLWGSVVLLLAWVIGLLWPLAALVGD